MLWNFTASLLIKVVPVYLLGHIDVGTEMFPGLDLQLSSFVFSNVKCYSFNRPSSRQVLLVCSNMFLVWLYTCDASVDEACDARKIKYCLVGEERFSCFPPILLSEALWEATYFHLHLLITEAITSCRHSSRKHEWHPSKTGIGFLLLSILSCAANIATYGTY